MYEYIKGTLIAQEDGIAIVECHGIAYRLHIPAPLAPTQEVLLYTHLVVKEDGHTLYAFPTKSSRDLFSLLITISGIGPKTALSIVGTLTLEALKSIVERMDATALHRVPGIGKKTAERLLVDLKAKLPTLIKMDIAHLVSAFTVHTNTAASDAISALINLGYTPTTAHHAIQQALHRNPTSDAPTLIREGLSPSPPAKEGLCPSTPAKEQSPFANPQLLCEEEGCSGRDDREEREEGKKRKRKKEKERV